MRTAALLALVAAAAGCGDSAVDVGSLGVYWTFRSHALGDIGAVTDTATSVCSAAGVDDVRITLTDPDGVEREPSIVSCITANDVPGAAFVGMATGTWSFRLEGRRARVVAYEASGTFPIEKSTRTLLDARAVPADGRWDVVVAFTSAACSAGDRLKFDLLFTGGPSALTLYSTDDPTVNPPVTVPCALSGSFTIPSVAAGSYAFSDWARVDAGGTPVAWSTCRPAWTQLASADTTTLSVDVSAGAPSPLPLGNGSVCPPLP